MEQAKEGRGIEFVKKNPGLAADALRISLAISTLYTISPEIEKTVKEDPAYKDFYLKLQCFSTISSALSNQSCAKYGVSLDSLCNAKVVNQKTQKGYAGVADVIYDNTYKKFYNNYQTFLAEKKED